MNPGHFTSGNRPRKDLTIECQSINLSLDVSTCLTWHRSETMSVIFHPEGSNTMKSQ